MRLTLQAWNDFNHNHEQTNDSVALLARDIHGIIEKLDRFDLDLEKQDFMAHAQHLGGTVSNGVQSIRAQAENTIRVAGTASECTDGIIVFVLISLVKVAAGAATAYAVASTAQTVWQAAGLSAAQIHEARVREDSLMATKLRLDEARRLRRELDVSDNRSTLIPQLDDWFVDRVFEHEGVQAGRRVFVALIAITDE